jgi:hypothetical protein
MSCITKKNLCENVIKTIFGAKNTITVREDLKKCGIRPHMWLQVNGVGFIKPTTSYVLEDEEKARFRGIILSLKTPRHYTSSLKKRV